MEIRLRVQGREEEQCLWKEMEGKKARRNEV